MALETVPDENLIEESSGFPRFPVNEWWRVLYGLFVIALPAFSFWAIQVLKPEWQSGELDAYLALFLQSEASIFFLLLLTYSIACYILLLINPDGYSSLFVVRFGVYTGVLLALQYSVILFLYLIDNKYSFAIVLLWLFPIYFPKSYRWAVSKWDTRRVLSSLGILVLIAVLIAVAYYREPFLPLFLAFVALIIAAPFWSFLIASQAAIWLFKNYETMVTLPRGLGVTAWLAAYAVAWRYDILKMYELYAKLPTAPPNCYIATAAAHGHPKLVRSWAVQLANGKSMRANNQLQILKCAELALMAIAPRLHKLLRTIYDVIGKSLAQKIQNPFLADVAYLMLKPFEWIAKFCLRLIIGDVKSISIGLYSK